MVIYYGKQTEDVLDRALRSCFGGPREIIRGEHGKPCFSDGDGFLSITHTAAGDLKIWIAVFSESEVGIDAESLGRRVDKAVAIAGRYFTEAETKYLAGLPEADRARAFIRLWTMKEAFLKMKGTGIAGGLDSVELVRDGMPVENCAGARFININIEQFPELWVTLAMDENGPDTDVRIVKLGDPGSEL